MSPVSPARAETYARYRLPYADEAARFVLDQTRPEAAADLGAGPGTLTRHFAGHVPTLYAIEPEPAMLTILQRELPGCVAIEAVAEATGLPDQSVDLILAANAYHRFDPNAAMAEFRRILRPGGWLAVLGYGFPDLVYREAFSALHSRFPEWSAQVRARRHTLPASTFFGQGDAQAYSFPQVRRQTWEEYIAATLSALEAPTEGDSWFGAFQAAHRELFDRVAVNGIWETRYSTELLLGQPRYQPQQGLVTPPQRAQE